MDAKNSNNLSGLAIPNFEPDDVEREGDKTTAAGDVLITDLLERLDDYKKNVVSENSAEEMAEKKEQDKPDEESQLRKKQKLFNLNFVHSSH